MTARSGDDSYYEICITLDSGDCDLAVQLSDIYISEIMDFSGEAVEIQGAKIIIRTSKDRQFIDALLAHIGELSANLREIWQKPIKTTHTIEKKQNMDWIAEYKREIKPLQCGKFYIYPPWEKPLGNLSLELHSADSANFGHSQTSSLVSRPKFAENYESQTENPSVVDSLHESNKKNSSLRENERSEFSWQSTNFCDSKNDKFKSARSATLKALSGAGVGVMREGEGSDFAIQAPTPSLKENARRQKGEFNADLSAESRKEIVSNLLSDSRDLDCFGDESPCNDESMQDAPKSELQNTINILLEPSLAFGTGHHASTFMCIEAIQALDAQDSLKNKKLLDFGCGSGILALCAQKLGAVVDLCDIDESAIVESKKNFNNNNATISHIWQGGIAETIAQNSAKSGIYDIIVANIIASVLIEQKDNIDSSLKCGGIAVLSGILDIYKDEVLARFSDFTPLAIRQKDEWICAILQKNRKNIA